jgi:hypothetical protein
MNNQQGEIILTYQVDHSAERLQQALKKMGYFEGFSFDDEPEQTFILPNNCMWHSSKSSAEAMRDLRKVCDFLGINLIRALAVRAEDFVPYSSGARENSLHIFCPN